jgi:hypothetical protein
MSDPEAATAPKITIVPPEVSSENVDTAVAFPVAFVSLVIALAVAIPVEAAAPKAVEERGQVEAAAAGEPNVPPTLNLRLPLVLIKAVTALVAACRAAAECVRLILFLLLVDNFPYQIVGLFLASRRPFDRDCHPYLTGSTGEGVWFLFH